MKDKDTDLIWEAYQNPDGSTMDPGRESHIRGLELQDAKRDMWKEKDDIVRRVAQGTTLGKIEWEQFASPVDGKVGRWMRHGDLHDEMRPVTDDERRTIMYFEEPERYEDLYHGRKPDWLKPDPKASQMEPSDHDDGQGFGRERPL